MSWYGSDVMLFPAFSKHRLIFSHPNDAENKSSEVKYVPDVFFVVFRPWIGLALGGIRALRRIAVGIPALLVNSKDQKSLRHLSGGRRILSAAGMPRRRGVGFVHAVVYDFHVWLRERVDRVAMLERIQTHLFSALFCVLLVLMMCRVYLYSVKAEEASLFHLVLRIFEQ